MGTRNASDFTMLTSATLRDHAHQRKAPDSLQNSLKTMASLTKSRSFHFRLHWNQPFQGTILTGHFWRKTTSTTVLSQKALRGALLHRRIRWKELGIKMVRIKLVIPAIYLMRNVKGGMRYSYIIMIVIMPIRYNIAIKGFKPFNFYHTTIRPAL